MFSRFLLGRALPLFAVLVMPLCAAPAATGAPVSAVTAQPVSDDDFTEDQDTADWETASGPLSQYDRNLLINVRWANLWEGPTSERIAERTTNPRVRAAANRLMSDHHELDRVVTAVAEKLGVPLPDEPTPLQRSWQDEILGKSGTEADDAWANITRRAHGTIFMSIGMVRALTRNDDIRAFTQAGSEIVMRHMTLLEGSGLVRSSSLVIGSTEAAPHQVLPGWHRVVFGIVLGLLVLVTTLVVVRVCARYTPRTAAE